MSMIAIPAFDARFKLTRRELATLQFIRSHEGRADLVTQHMRARLQAFDLITSGVRLTDRGHKTLEAFEALPTGRGQP